MRKFGELITEGNLVLDISLPWIPFHVQSIYSLVACVESFQNTSVTSCLYIYGLKIKDTAVFTDVSHHAFFIAYHSPTAFMESNKNMSEKTEDCFSKCTQVHKGEENSQEVEQLMVKGKLTNVGDIGYMYEEWFCSRWYGRVYYMYIWFASINYAVHNCAGQKDCTVSLYIL